MELWQFDFMRRALLAAGLVGMAAPAIGVFLVQKRLSLMGDGIGHVALTGVAIGFLTATSPILWAASAALAGAVAIETVRRSGKAAADVALALIFYGGIAGGVFITSLSEASNAGLLGYLFGSVLSVGPEEVRSVMALSFLVLAATIFFRKQFFAVCFDEEVAKVAGIPVNGFNLLLAGLAALTVITAMRVVGLLLVAAMMVVPVAAAQLISRSFNATVLWGVVIGMASSILGVVLAFHVDAAPGPTIVLVALSAFFGAATFSRWTGKIA